MKIKERALSLLLSLVMVLTFMPALAFAEGDEAPDAENAPVVEEPIVEEPAEDTDDAEFVEVPEEVINQVPALSEPEEGTEEASLVYSGGTTTKQIEFGDYPWFVDDETITITIGESSYTYKSIYGEDAIEWIYSGEGSDPLGLSWVSLSSPEGVNAFGVGTAFTYQVIACLNEDTDNEQLIESGSYNGTIIPKQSGYVGNLWFELNNDGTASLEGIYGSFDSYEQYVQYTATITSISIPASVSFGDGLTHTVTSIGSWALYDLVNCKSVYVPASIVNIGNGAIGYYWSSEQDLLVPGVTIFGTTGTAAQAYANNNGIAFRDLAAEAEAARQGTPGSLPGVKASKPKAAKKAITVKWKKLNKKQLKKGVSNIEVWVCTDGAFRSGATIEKVTGKKKSSLKIKGLQKGVTYYVKVRAITYSGGTKIVGPWSSVKTVKVKK